jgi:hypothetical protein
MHLRYAHGSASWQAAIEHARALVCMQVKEAQHNVDMIKKGDEPCSIAIK